MSAKKSFLDTEGHAGHRYAPAFLIPKESDDGQQRYVTLSLRQILQWTGTTQTPARLSTSQTLSSILARSHRPLVILPEGTTSNNVRQD